MYQDSWITEVDGNMMEHSSVDQWVVFLGGNPYVLCWVIDYCIGLFEGLFGVVTACKGLALQTCLPNTLSQIRHCQSLI